MNKNEIISGLIDESIAVKKELHTLVEKISQISDTINSALKSGHKILICGNGGSAADSQHFAAELTGRFKTERKALPAIALHTDTSALTAIGNDYGYDKVFVRQLEALGKPGDVLVCISTSGNSPNVVLAAEYAKKHGILTIGLLGGSGGKLKDIVNVDVIVPHTDTARIQESHILIIHSLCALIDKEFT